MCYDFFNFLSDQECSVWAGFVMNDRKQYGSILTLSNGSDDVHNSGALLGTGHFNESFIITMTVVLCFTSDISF